MGFIITSGVGLGAVLPDIYWLTGWAVALFAIGILLFRRSMTS